MAGAPWKDIHISQLISLLVQVLVDLNMSSSEYPSLSREEGSVTYGRTRDSIDRILELDQDELVTNRSFNAIVKKLQALFNTSNNPTFREFISGYNTVPDIVAALQAKITTLEDKSLNSDDVPNKSFF